MKLLQYNNITGNIVSGSVVITELGSTTLDREAEREQLEDYVQVLSYANIDFTAHMKIEDKLPTVTEDEIGVGVEEVSLKNLINRNYELREGAEISLSINLDQIDESELTTVFNTKALLAQARIVLFESKIIEEINRMMTELREADNAFEGEKEILI